MIKGVVPHDDAVFFFNFIAPYTWLEVFKRFSQPEKLVAFFNELTELSVDKKEDTSMFLNKTEVLNGALENIPSSMPMIYGTVWGITVMATH